MQAHEGYASELVSGAARHKGVANFIVPLRPKNTSDLSTL
eukprot:COSAG01_NODE_6047_length_3881_cov_3.726864_7_plen_40_part_00